MAGLLADYGMTAIKRKGASAPLMALMHKWDPDFWNVVYVLDWGCGFGADVAFMRKRGLQAIGFDPSPRFPEWNHQPVGKYDVVLLTYVLNTLPPSRRIKCLREAWDRLAGGGNMFVANRDPGDIRRTAKKERWGTLDDGYVTSSGTFQTPLDRAGMEKLFDDASVYPSQVVYASGHGWTETWISKE